EFPALSLCRLVCVWVWECVWRKVPCAPKRDFLPVACLW
ncbi:hypothetical protein CPC197_1337B, partial [Chlamydia psittaci C1/97]